MNKRCPSFSSRPGFPKGLKVLVLEESSSRAMEAETLLLDCGFYPIICLTAADATKHLVQSSGVPDIMLIEVACLEKRSHETAIILTAAKTLPLVLMATNLCPKEIVSGITKRGAVDFMEKPLHPQKLKNIWQHVVRKMMVGGSTCGDNTRSEPISPGSVSLDCLSSGTADSVSNASTQLKQEPMELDYETSSLVDAAELALGNPLAGLAHGFSHLLMEEQLTTDTPVKAAQASTSQASSGTTYKPRGRLSGELRRIQHPFLQQSPAARPSSTPPTNAVTTRAMPTPNSPTDVQAQPVLGHSCGQLPALVQAGMVWGLPTNPLYIAPRPSPLSALMPGAMGGPWIPPMMMMQPHNMMMGMPGMFGIPPTPMMMPPTAPTSSFPGSVLPSDNMSNSQYKRAESADFKESTMSSNLGMLHSLSYSSGLSTFSESKVSQEKLGWYVSLDLSESAEKPSIGLQLKKTPSLMNMINCSLESAMKGAATVVS
ncbi:hypothetical protein CEUSTIGMA_g2463.t1 [Chlamydomonas eustigma]|uniref:Response regulatory domain-containing protein n=1 Tax=Chlamydomonas eustigma TaxID=1157962 RepID=A0A250WW07_9CHLO|nr:hypothetical protein CEUSTIGMA_g2463.t1 [Chlamydomonas eustigma]|eukprot:GAX75017.1 hypothetical protein CEUSTIGMA_g2463.t1 [Chlamydomonas eustigma]